MTEYNANDSDHGVAPRGVQPRRDDRLQCLECGRWFKAMGSHLDRVHGMTANQYREKWGLTTRHALASDASRQRWAQSSRRQLPTRPRAARAFHEQATVQRQSRQGHMSTEARQRIAESSRRPEAKRHLRALSEHQAQLRRQAHEQSARAAGYPDLRAALRATVEEPARVVGPRLLGISGRMLQQLRVDLEIVTPARRLTPPQRQAAVQEVLDGADITQVAGRVGLSVDCLARWVRRTQPAWQRPPQPADNGHVTGTLRARARTDDERRQAVAEVIAGASYAATARKYGVTDTTIRNWYARELAAED